MLFTDLTRLVDDEGKLKALVDLDEDEPAVLGGFEVHANGQLTTVELVPTTVGLLR